MTTYPLVTGNQEKVISINSITLFNNNILYMSLSVSSFSASFRPKSLRTTNYSGLLFGEVDPEQWAISWYDLIKVVINKSYDCHSMRQMITFIVPMQSINYHVSQFEVQFKSTSFHFILWNIILLPWIKWCIVKHLHSHFYQYLPLDRWPFMLDSCQLFQSVWYLSYLGRGRGGLRNFCIIFPQKKGLALPCVLI